MTAEHSRLIRLVLALYPRDVRQRYGDEIADLLATSPTPRRDLADVVWCALLDRVASLTLANVRTRVVRTAGLFCIPAAASVSWGIVFSFFLGAANVLVVAGASGRTMDGAVTVGSVVSSGLLVGAAIGLGRRIGRRRSVATAAVFVPFILASGFTAVAVTPWIGIVFGESTPASVVASACWCGAIVALAAGVGALVRRGRTRLAVAVAALGAFVILDATTIVYVVLALPAGLSEPAWTSVLWYLDAADPADSRLLLTDANGVNDLVKNLPTVLTICSALVLASVTAAARRHRTVESPESAADGVADAPAIAG